MNWFADILKKREPVTDTSAYPSRKYKKVLCSRQHCTDACSRSHSEMWKFWSLFLSSSLPNHHLLFANISSMPDILRFAVYSKCFKMRALSKQTSQDDSDPLLTSQIIAESAKLDYKYPKDVFNIYKLLESSFNLNHLMINIIIGILKLDGSSVGKAYGILYGLLDRHGLDELIADEEKNKEIFQIAKIAIEERPKVWLFMTDLVIALKCTYKQIIERTRKFSKMDEPAKVVAVLAGRKNTKYYAGEYGKDEKKEKNKKEKKETYFDFLVVQNELIKAQENIKSKLNEEKKKLEDENIELKMVNQELRNELAMVPKP